MTTITLKVITLKKINKWQPFKTIEENGLLGKRMDLWRAKRLWFVTDTGFLLSGFESRPSNHLWQGKNNREWIAFSYGPLTLAEKISEKPAEEPFVGLDTTLVTRKEIQSMLVREEKNDTTFRFNVKGTEVYLIPYY